MLAVIGWKDNVYTTKVQRKICLILIIPGEKDKKREDFRNEVKGLGHSLHTLHHSLHQYINDIQLITVKLKG